MVGREPRNDRLGGSSLVGLRKGYLEESKQREVVEKSLVGRNALGAPARRGSEKGLKSLLASPFVPEGQLVIAYSAGINIITPSAN